MKFRSKVNLCIAILATSATALASAVSVSPAPDPQSLPTGAAIVSALKASELSNKVPKGTINPPLTATGLFWTSVNPATGNPSKPGCIINDAATTIPADISTSCSFGDTASSTVIALVGDSNANAWIPAFDTWGFVNHVKVVAVVHAACAPWDRPWLPKDKPIWGDITERKCSVWRASMFSKISSLAPKYVFPVGIATTDKQLIFPSQSAVVASMASMIKRIGSKKAVLIEPVPQFSLASAVLACVTAHSTNLNQCTVSKAAVSGSFMNQVVKTVATSQKVGVVSTQNLFCATLTCPIFVTISGKNYLLYEDGYHISHQYSQLIGAALPLKNFVK